MRAATIYLVTNLENGHRYVGLTRFTCGQRWKEHVRNAKRGLRTYLYAAIRKYGTDSFRVMDIASCLSLDTAVEVERAVIQSMRPEYNQTNGGEFTVGKRVPREVVEKIRAGNIGKKRTVEQKMKSGRGVAEWYANNPEARKKNAEHLAKIRARPGFQENRIAAVLRAAKEGKMSHALSPERKAIQLANISTPAAKKKMAESKSKPVECTTLATIFDSVSEAAEFTGLSISGVSSVCRGIVSQAHGLHFRFLGVKNGQQPERLLKFQK